jgi:hypothetical protein
VTPAIRVWSLPPDLRFGAVESLARPGQSVDLGGVTVRSRGCLPSDAAVPAYLRYADREASLRLEAGAQPGDLERALASRVRALGQGSTLDDLCAAVMALDAVDVAFRTTGLWPGNIYLAGLEALRALLHVAVIAEPGGRPPAACLHELQALELVYLFPIAPKFRDGVYDGQVQFRLNGWGRALARRLADSDTGGRRDELLRQRIGAHLVDERGRYAAFLGDLEVVRQHYTGDRFARALTLPIPVLV